MKVDSKSETSASPSARRGGAGRPLDYFFDEKAQRNFIYIVALGAAGSLLAAYLYSVALHPVNWVRHVAFLFV